MYFSYALIVEICFFLERLSNGTKLRKRYDCGAMIIVGGMTGGGGGRETKPFIAVCNWVLPTIYVFIDLNRFY